ncbi:lectin-like protein [Methylovulum sp.]|uniref:lectin-like protein n=1 Tax=Methylovulum sp. TaxID=1916980 RepID=UPI0026233AF1|nr:lectin-like protein [Methylovulum sp.]MDD5124331.1 lectin-like protein [Methylovulum sp.]
MASITSSDEQAFVQSQFKGAGNLWLGLSDYVTEGSFQWVTSEPFTYNNWNTGQPDNKKDAEDCAVVNSVGKWEDVNCDISLPALIEYE